MKVIIGAERLGLMPCARKIAATYRGTSAPAHLSIALTTNDAFNIAGQFTYTSRAIPEHRRCRIRP